jgi:hypothetical protein
MSPKTPLATIQEDLNCNATQSSVSDSLHNGNNNNNNLSTTMNNMNMNASIQSPTPSKNGTGVQVSKSPSTTIRNNIQNKTGGSINGMKSLPSCSAAPLYAWELSGGGGTGTGASRGSKSALHLNDIMYAPTSNNGMYLAYMLHVTEVNSFILLFSLLLVLTFFSLRRVSSCP